MKYYIIAGESSGDLYGGLLMQEIQKRDENAEFRFWGGPKMKAHSSGQLKSIKETSFMGFYEVAKNVLKIKGFFNFAKYSIKDYNPDMIIFIDYPGFNLRMATWAKNQGYNTTYYISPQLWAWKQNRHKILKEKIDLFFVILPFEQDFYRNLDTPCTYVGHPLLEVIPASKKVLPTEVKTVGLFPGSRKQEISNHLKIMVDFAVSHPNLNFIIAGVSHIDKSFYVKHLDQYAPNLDIRYDAAYSVMEEVDFAISSSGTATLELALYDVPQIVVYKTSQLSFAIGKRLVKTDYIALVNLIAQKEVVPELLQHAFNELAIKEYFAKESSLNNRQQIQADYHRIRAELSKENSSAKVAKGIISFLNSKGRNSNTAIS